MSEVSAYCDAPVGSCLQTERLENLEAENGRLRQALQEIANREGMTQLHDCCADRSCVPVFFDAEQVAHCLFQFGVNRGFNECASDARAALEGK
jgi:hypothetical protein